MKQVDMWQAAERTSTQDLVTTSAAQEQYVRAHTGSQLRTRANNIMPIKHMCMWQAAERTITQDLESLISKAVDPAKADYAVISGVQIHVCTKDSVSGSLRELVDYVWPSASYVVSNGQRQCVPARNMGCPSTLSDWRALSVLRQRCLCSLSASMRQCWTWAGRGPRVCLRLLHVVGPAAV